METDHSLTDLMIVVGIIFVVLFLVLSLGSITAEQAMGDGEGERVQTAAVLDEAGTWTAIDNNGGTDETVLNSRGYAVNLTGADDSYVESDGAVDVATSDTWTVSVWAHVDQGAGDDSMVAASVDGRAVISYNGSAGQWQGWYYEDGSRQSYVVNVSTSGDEVGNYTNIMLWHNNGQLTILRNNTAGEMKSTSGESIVSAPVGASNWDGRLEELRTFDDALNSSERQTVVDSPLEPMPGSDPTARIMFDEPYRSSQHIFYSDADLETHNTTFSAGFEGKELQEGDYAMSGSDYKWNPSGPQIRPLNDGELDGAPVAYVDYTKTGVATQTWIETTENTILLAAMIPLVLIVAFAIGVLRDSR